MCLSLKLNISAKAEGSLSKKSYWELRSIKEKTDLASCNYGIDTEQWTYLWKKKSLLKGYPYEHEMWVRKQSKSKDHFDSISNGDSEYHKLINQIQI